MNDAALAARCLSCGAAFEPQDISPKRRFAECSHCGTLHNVSSFLTPDQCPLDRVERLPDNIQFGENKDGATIRWQADESAHKFVIVSLLVILAGPFELLAVAGVAFARSSKQPLAIAMAVGVGLVFWPALYARIVGFLNRTVITLDSFAIRAASRPLPWRVSRSFQLANVYCAFAHPVRNPKGRDCFHLSLWMKDGRAVSLTPDKPLLSECKHLLHLLNRSIERLRQSATAPDDEPAEAAPVVRRSRGHKEVTSHLSLFHVRRRGPAKRDTRDLTCMSCGAPIPLEAINRAELSASCTYCGVVRDVRDFLKVTGLHPRRESAYLPAEISLQKSKAGASLKLLPPHRLKRFFTYAIPVGLVAVPILAMFVPVMAVAVSNQPFSRGVLIALAGGLPFAGLALIGKLWLRTNPPVYVTLTSNQLQRKSGRATEDYSIPTAQLTGFVALESNEAGNQHSYCVLAENEAGERYVVAHGLTSPSYALIIRDAFESCRLAA